MSSQAHYDVVVIGSGAGGGTLAWRLATAGKQVLLLERGQFLPREKQNWDSREVWINHRYQSDTWRDAQGRPFNPEVYYYVGGNTKMYGAMLIRLRKEDFGELRHHDGVSPPWPIGYEDLEPYYTEAERLYQVRGLRGVDPTDPPASAPYPFPPLEHEPRIQELSDDLAALGCRPFPLPMAVRYDARHPEHSPCIRCDTCDGHPCLVQGKSDAEVSAVRPALQHPNMTLLTGAQAVRLETSPSGREVTKVVVERDGAVENYRGHFVVVAAGAANTARLLLMSANDKHPLGLANGSGQVGRNFLCHNRTVLLAVTARKNPTRFQQTVGLNDYYFGDGESEFPLGNIQMLGKTKGEIFRAKGPALAPQSALNAVADRTLDFFLTTEDLPRPENRITIDSKGGIRLAYRPNNQEPARQLELRLKDLLRQIGRRKGVLYRHLCIVERLGLEGLGHQAGVCRFGVDRATSVLDPNCKAHELDNLYVADASFFPSIGAVNPSLTIMANALRVGDHLLERLNQYTTSTRGGVDDHEEGDRSGGVVGPRPSTGQNPRRRRI